MMMMTDIRERFHATDLIPDPDLWPSVRTRLAERGDDPAADLHVLRGRRAPDQIRKIVTIAAALAIGVTSTLVALPAFREVETKDTGKGDTTFGIFAPARGWIVYGRGSAVVAFDPEGDPDRQVVLFRATEPGQIRGVTWSPDGRKLLIIQGGGQQRYAALVVDANGRETNLGRVSGFGVQATWSPDGKQIALATGRGIVVVRVVGGTRTVLVSSAERSAGSPTWLPDGGRIAFLRGGVGDPAISEVDVATGEIREIFRLPSSPRWRDLYGLQVSPDGSQFLLGGCPRSDKGAWTCYAYVLGADGTGYRAVTLDHISEWPAWSPKGGRIVYGESNGPRVFVMGAAGRDARMVSTEGRGPFAWHPG
jgi:WD40-like Beta Propeller Repeat